MDEVAASTDAVLATLNEMVFQACASLVSALAVCQPDHRESDAEDTLKFLLPLFQGSLCEICMRMLDKGTSEVPFMQFIELEEEVRRIIEDLREKGMFPETEDQASVRMEAMGAPMNRIVVFLEQITGGAGAELAGS
jgi:hypothetical protein